MRRGPVRKKGSMRRSPAKMGPDAAGPVNRGHQKKTASAAAPSSFVPADYASLMRPT
jgi:hypothetical protein